MGVPGVFVWLTKQFGNIILKPVSSKNNDILLLDANCAFHPQCALVLANYKKGNLEKLMFKQIVKYIQYLVKCIRPKVLYIAVDGVAPASKINQQRSRRFKSVKDKLLLNSIKKKYGEESISTWDTCNLTPGTQFMSDLMDYIQQAIDENKFGDIKCIFSSSNEPGEGEHKIMKYLMKHSYNRIIIYGLDADLIFLSLASNIDNILLLRELNPDEKKEEMKLQFIDIDILKTNISKLINIRDFIFITFFAGNDFLPSLPSISIKNGGLSLLVSEWQKANKILKTTLIMDDLQINEEFLRMFINNISQYEVSYFQHDLPRQIDMHNRRQPKVKTPCERELFNVNNLVGVEDDLRLHEPGYKSRYYTKHFGEYNKDIIISTSREYVKGLLWILQYYFAECCSWNWYYPYYYAPCVTDFNLVIHKYCVHEMKITFELSKPLKKTEQLLAVLPATSVNLLPKKYRYLMTDDKSPIIDLYPIDFVQDCVHKFVLYKAIPLLPSLNLERITELNV